MKNITSPIAKRCQNRQKPAFNTLLAPFDGFGVGRDENFQFSPDRVEKGCPKCPTARGAEIKCELRAPIMAAKSGLGATVQFRCSDATAPGSAPSTTH